MISPVDVFRTVVPPIVTGCDGRIELGEDGPGTYGFGAVVTGDVVTGETVVFGGVTNELTGVIVPVGVFTKDVPPIVTGGVGVGE